MTQLSSSKRHIAQQKQWTKHCSWLMTQWDLLFKAWSMPYVLTLRLPKQCCEPNNTKDAKPARSLNCCHSSLNLIVDHKPQWFKLVKGERKRRQITSETAAFHIEQLCTLCWKMVVVTVVGCFFYTCAMQCTYFAHSMSMQKYVP